jgi:hypothetical protein
MSSVTAEKIRRQRFPRADSDSALQDSKQSSLAMSQPLIPSPSDLFHSFNTTYDLRTPRNHEQSMETSFKRAADVDATGNSTQATFAQGSLLAPAATMFGLSSLPATAALNSTSSQGFQPEPARNHSTDYWLQLLVAEYHNQKNGLNSQSQTQPLDPTSLSSRTVALEQQGPEVTQQSTEATLFAGMASEAPADQSRLLDTSFSGTFMSSLHPGPGMQGDYSMTFNEEDGNYAIGEFSIAAAAASTDPQNFQWNTSSRQSQVSSESSETNENNTNSLATDRQNT